MLYLTFKRAFRMRNGGKLLFFNHIKLFNNESSGVDIPDAPTTCCMSGCANCVWLEYAEQLVKLLKKDSSKSAKDIIMEKVTDPNMKAFLLVELASLKPKNDDPSGLK